MEFHYHESFASRLVLLQPARPAAPRVPAPRIRAHSEECAATVKREKRREHRQHRANRQRQRKRDERKRQREADAEASEALAALGEDFGTL